MAATASPTRPSGIRKVIATAVTGATIEWYDFFIYATAAALVFPRLFFPGLSPLTATLASFSTFAVGMVARPLGGVLFGHIGDRVGRKHALVLALVTMGVATTLIGMLPTYATIGVLAPALLTALRFVQGLAIGGQWGGAMLLATEHAPPHRRGLYGGLVQTGVPAGKVLANGVFVLIIALVTDAQFDGWAWRLPFLISVVLLGVAIYVQFTLHDAPVFEDLKQTNTRSRTPVLEAIRRHPREILLAAGAFVAYIATYYVIVSWAMQYATTELGLSKGAILAPEMVGAIAQIGTVLIGAWLATALFAWASDSTAVSGYLLLVAVVSFASVVGLHETRGQAIDDTGTRLPMPIATSPAGR